MDRRLCTRLVPRKELKAFLANSRVPNKVLDYCVDGIAIRMNDKQRFDGRRCKVDLMLSGKLCVCGLPGVVRWSNGKAAGINLVPKTRHQVRAVRNVETELMRI